MTCRARGCALAVGLVAAAAAWSAAAETLYVIDRLEIGVHESTTIDSVVVEVVPTGTALEVLERRDEFVKVRTPAGATGWVDAAYVTDEEPAAVATDALEAKLAETMRELGAARAEVEVLRQQLAEGAPGEDEAPASSGAEQQARDAAAELGATLDELQALAEENQRLKRRLSELRAERAASVEAMRAANAEPAQADPPPARPAPGNAPSASSWLDLGPWRWALAGFVLLLAFALGGYVVDWQTRRRHGGFRI